MMPYRFYSNRRMEPKVFSQKASTFDEAKSNFELGELHARARTAKQEKEKVRRSFSPVASSSRLHHICLLGSVLG